jgi:hypothetical protein
VGEHFSHFSACSVVRHVREKSVVVEMKWIDLFARKMVFALEFVGPVVPQSSLSPLFLLWNGARSNTVQLSTAKPLIGLYWTQLQQSIGTRKMSLSRGVYLKKALMTTTNHCNHIPSHHISGDGGVVSSDVTVSPIHQSRSRVPARSIPFQPAMLLSDLELSRYDPCCDRGEA